MDRVDLFAWMFRDVGIYFSRYSVLRLGSRRLDPWNQSNGCSCMDMKVREICFSKAVFGAFFAELADDTKRLSFMYYMDKISHHYFLHYIYLPSYSLCL